MLIKNLYKIDKVTGGADNAVFDVTLFPDCEVYKGHFPGMPITPGVCTTQMVKECAETLLNRITVLSEIKLCKFAVLITPSELPHARVNVSLSEEGDAFWLLYGSVQGPDGQVYMTIKALLNG